jgi:hypothetical protein
MADDSTPGTAVARTDEAPRRVREVRVVENPMGIMDTARFEHLARVAKVMAMAGLMPQSLTHFKPPGAGENVQPAPLEYEVVQARAFLIANQADLFHMDPNALAQCVSIVHGKLMYEGKLVHALIAERLGIDLLYEFGRFDAGKRDVLGTLSNDPETGQRIWEGEMPPTLEDQGLGVRVVGTLPGEVRPRWIAGSVAMWHKGAKSPWANATAWPRQLRYMGAREWCRAYKPSLLLGILTDDEVDEYELGRAVGQIAPSAPQLLHADFEDRRTGELTQPEPPKASRKRRTAPSAPEEGAAGVSGPADGSDASQAAAAALGGDDLPEGLKANDEIRQPGPDLSTGGDASLSAASNEGAESNAGEDDTGHAAAGEAYVLAGEEASAEGRRLVYKDGVRFSTVADPGKYPAFSRHAPEVADTEVHEEEPQGGEETTGFPPEFTAFIEACEAAKSWVEIKAAMAVFWKTDFFKALPAQKQDHIRANTWKTAVAGNLADLPDHAADISAFRLWIEVCEDPDAIDGTLRVLEGQTDFAGKETTFKDAIRKAAQVRTAALRAG